MTSVTQGRLWRLNLLPPSQSHLIIFENMSHILLTRMLPWFQNWVITIREREQSPKSTLTNANIHLTDMSAPPQRSQIYQRKLKDSLKVKILGECRGNLGSPINPLYTFLGKLMLSQYNEDIETFDNMPVSSTTVMGLN